MSKNDKIHKPSTLPLIAGTIGGAVSTISLYPLDLVKVRLQVYESHNNNALKKATASTSATNTKTTAAVSGHQSRNPRSMAHVLRGIIRHEGFLGLYNGLTPAIVGSAASWGGYFFFYEGLKTNIIQQKQKRSSLHGNDNDPKLGAMENFTAACVSGAILVGFTNPIWLIKTRMQLQIKSKGMMDGTTKNVTEKIKPPYKNMFDAGRTIIREEGFASLYKGAGPALMLVSHGGVQFVCYEFMKGYFGVYKKATRISKGNSNDNGRSSGKSNSILHRLEDSLGYLTMGAVSKIVATTVTYPLQVIKSRLQQRSQTTELSASGEVEIVRRQYNGVADCIRRIWVNEGILGFFKGCLPNAIRVAPSAAITFVVYESVTDMLSET